MGTLAGIAIGSEIVFEFSVVSAQIDLPNRLQGGTAAAANLAQRAFLVLAEHAAVKRVVDRLGYGFGAIAGTTRVCRCLALTDSAMSAP